MTFVKFCGMTREQDIDLACELGVQAVGFILWPRSPRFVDTERLAALIARLPKDVMPVGVFVSPSAEEIDHALSAGVGVVQLHGTPVAGFNGARVPQWIARPTNADLTDVPPSVTVLLDTHDPERHGGTGRTIDWTRAAEIASSRQVMLAGGLTPANVAGAIRQVRPYGVDVASGIEDQPGIKNAQAMRAFVTAVREAEQ